MIRHFSPSASTRSRARSSLPIAAAMAARFSAGSAIIRAYDPRNPSVRRIAIPRWPKPAGRVRRRPRRSRRRFVSSPGRRRPARRSSVPASTAAWPSGATWSTVIDGHLDVGLTLERGQPRGLAGPDDQVGDQDVVDPAGGHDLGLGDLGHRHPDRARPAQQVRDRRALERLGMGTPRHPTCPEVARHQVDVLLERLQVDQEGRRIQLAHRQADRAELHGVLGSRRASENPRQTCDGISNRWLYSRASSALASASLNDSVPASKVSFLPVRSAMLPRWQSRVLRWPISMSALGFSRLLTQSRKFCDVARLAVAAALALGPVAFFDPPAFVADDQRALFRRRRRCRRVPLRCRGSTRSGVRKQCRHRGIPRSTVCVSGVSWSSSKTYLPPPELTAIGRIDAQAPAGDVDDRECRYSPARRSPSSRTSASCNAGGWRGTAGPGLVLATWRNRCPAGTGPGWPWPMLTRF